MGLGASGWMMSVRAHRCAPSQGLVVHLNPIDFSLYITLNLIPICPEVCILDAWEEKS